MNGVVVQNMNAVAWPSWRRLAATARLPLAAAFLLVGTGLLGMVLESTLLTVVYLLSQIIVISLIIWQACDPFADAAQWIGIRFRLPGSVRGATLDAIASSMPELFSGIFFVVVAVFAADEAVRMHAGSDGYGAVVATCAGSAVYNMVLIPAACALVISFTRRKRPTIDVAPVVIRRDGVWFVLCETLLILFLFQPALTWWMGMMFLLLYLAYVGSLYTDAKRFQTAMAATHQFFARNNQHPSREGVEQAFDECGLNSPCGLADEVHQRLLQESGGHGDDDEQQLPDKTSVLLGLFDVPLNAATVWMVIAVATTVAAAACFWLVSVTRSISTELEIPIFFVAVIVAAAASSVPDTFLSIGAARRGDDDGTVSNAFGSNIFDVCICMSLPLLVGTYLSGWQPISLTQDGQPMPGLVGIRVMLCVLTVVTLLIMWHKHQLTRRKAIVLCALYALFVAYAVAGSLGVAF